MIDVFNGIGLRHGRNIANDIAVFEIPFFASIVFANDALNEAHVDKLFEVNASSFITEREMFSDFGNADDEVAVINVRQSKHEVVDVSISTAKPFVSESGIFILVVVNRHVIPPKDYYFVS